jgi:hypothetical protein
LCASDFLTDLDVPAARGVLALPTTNADALALLLGGPAPQQQLAPLGPRKVIRTALRSPHRLG